MNLVISDECVLSDDANTVDNDLLDKSKYKVYL